MLEQGASLPDWSDLERRDLLDALALLRWANPMPMGGWLPLSWAEIDAFARLTGRLSSPWEAETVAAMSAAYVSGLTEGRDLLSIMPVERD